MKTGNFILLLFIFAFSSCTNRGDSTGTGADSAKDKHAVAEATTGLFLNNGAKWNTDESTRNHVQTISTIIDNFNKKPNANVTEYHSFASELENEVNTLIKDCNMTGPDHEALHQWLQPVLKGVNNLKKVQTKEEGQHEVQMLTEQVQQFNIYFN